LAKKYNGSICTIDYNLNKVAKVEGIVVLNVNDLAMSLRMAYLPGEKMLLELTAKGQDGHQAVGHLTDGTMVVVEHASSQIGHTVEIEFIRSLQTAAGKMMFAKAVKPERINQKLAKVNKQPAIKPVNKPNSHNKQQQVKNVNSDNHQNRNTKNNNRKQYRNKPAQQDQGLIDLLNSKE
jgi:hypothetical protein